MLQPFLVSFALTAFCCWIVSRLVAVPELPFDRHLRGLSLRMAGRGAVVLLVLGVGLRVLGQSAAGWTFGTLAGWLGVACGEFIRQRSVPLLGERDDGRASR